MYVDLLPGATFIEHTAHRVDGQNVTVAFIVIRQTTQPFVNVTMCCSMNVAPGSRTCSTGVMVAVTVLSSILQ